MIRAVLILLASVLPASAETARILSGEHGDFTRLVIELPAGEGWTLGRTDAGYAFAAKGERQPGYDLSRVWQRIGRNRLAALTADPMTGALDLSIACACHVFPFEYQPGIVVLDIKPGPPPEGSTFEAPFALPAPTQALPQDAASGQGYDWLARPDRTAPRTAPPLPFPLATGVISLEPLRDELLEQLARGAADGIVDMELPGKPPKSPVDDRETPWSNIRIGEAPGIIVTEPNALSPEPRPDDSCAAPELVDLPAWAGGAPPEEVLAKTRDGLFGEFDQPDEAAIVQAVQSLLYLGFGAEARQTATLADPQAAGDRLPLYRSMSYLVDGDSDPQTPFAGMLHCDGPAALWAALAYDRLPAGPGVNRDAIIQAFQALPPHLRLHLGPALAEKFLARDDADATRMIRDAMERAPEPDPAAVALLDAKAELHRGDAEAAQEHAQTAVALDGAKPESLVALVEAHFRKLQPLDPGIADELLAQQGENEGTEAGPAIDRAVVLALALSDRIEDAFAQGATSNGTEADLWQVVQARATDDDFLRHAVLHPDETRPGVASDVALAIGRRLLTLGFPDAALVWLGPVAPTDAPELRLVAATAELDRGEAQAAADLLAGLQGTEAAALRAKAQVALGDLAAASTTLAATGDVDGAARLALWSGDWAGLTPTAPKPWQDAAAFAAATRSDPSQGLLGRGGKAIDESLASRDAIQALLASVPSPTGN